MRQVAGAGVDRAGRVGVHGAARHPFRMTGPVGVVPAGDVGHRHRRGRVDARVLHLERFEQALADQFGPGSIVRGGGGEAGGGEHRALILERGAERFGERQAGETADGFFGLPRGAIPQSVVARHSSAMTHQVAQPHLAVGQRIGQMKPAQVLAHTVVPVQLFLIDQHGHGGGRESLAARAQGEERVRGDRVFLALGADAVPGEIENLVVADNRHGGAGDVPFRHGLPDQRIQEREHQEYRREPAGQARKTRTERRPGERCSSGLLLRPRVRMVVRAGAFSSKMGCRCRTDKGV